MSDTAGHGLLAWAGIAVSAIGGLLGHLHLRVSRLEDRVSDGHAALQAQLGGGDDKLWLGLAEMRRDEVAFRERLLREMASKADISELRASVERLASDFAHHRRGGGD